MILYLINNSIFIISILIKYKSIMNFTLNIRKKYFDLIKNHKKSVELRLYDEKRKLINIGDIITFVSNETKEELIAKVIKLHKAKNFEELLKNIDIEKTGFKTIEDLNKNILEFYSIEKQNNFGVLGIEIKVIDN